MENYNLKAIFVCMHTVSGVYFRIIVPIESVSENWPIIIMIWGDFFCCATNSWKKARMIVLAHACKIIVSHFDWMEVEWIILFEPILSSYLSWMLQIHMRLTQNQHQCVNINIPYSCIDLFKSNFFSTFTTNDLSLTIRSLT